MSWNPEEYNINIINIPCTYVWVNNLTRRKPIFLTTLENECVSLTKHSTFKELFSKVKKEDQNDPGSL